MITFNINKIQFHIELYSYIIIYLIIIELLVYPKLLSLIPQSLFTFVCVFPCSFFLYNKRILFFLFLFAKIMASSILSFLLSGIWVLFYYNIFHIFIYKKYTFIE